MGTGPVNWRTTCRLFATAVALAALAGCGAMPDPGTPQPPAADLGQPGDATTGGGVPNVDDAATRPPSLTLGTLSDRMSAAMGGITSYRATFVGSGADALREAREAGTAATPVGAGRGPFTVSREFIAPDRQRQVLTGAGSDDHEAILIGPALYVRGPLAASIDPSAGPDDWLALPIDAIDPETPGGAALSGLLSPPRSPLADIGENLRPQAVRDLGPRTVEGRACRVWGAADTTPIGTRLDIAIAVDGDNLPCLLETRMGADLVSSVTYDRFGAVEPIEAPASATAVAAPVAATPVGRD